MTVNDIELSNELQTEAVAPVVVTTCDGVIEFMTPNAAVLLRLSAARAVGRDLLPYFSANREHVMQRMRKAAWGSHEYGTASIRPRERAPIPVSYDVVLVSDAEGQSLRWTFRSLTAEPLSLPPSPKTSLGN